ncbi:M23 family metallopeptidase [Cesiribacter andamanensis]|uniref:Glycyl-glycine endopeptidase ALE-1 n=1 Tax=Cesiribacter andamanensis AMV16 TaxID=1279009 RepID=M7NSW0_9BACT|nr:M23 family metallopeptidase [Cesiribacter andamanensis]EMR01579.1 Glycyl-glycine endopeptidase ALE-1 precursor [Cesiribacter andamanensis AMV16]
MARIKYYYDTDTCRYERIERSRWEMFLNTLGILMVTCIMAIIMVTIYFEYFDSPKEAQMRKEIEEYKLYQEVVEKDITRLSQMVQVLQERDDNIYRTIFEAEPIPSTIRQAGVGGTERYKNLLEKGLSRDDLILSNLKKIDQLKKQMYIQTKSYDELFRMANDKEKMWASIPAIQPISNKELNRMASGFGLRIHPIYKVRRMHTGCDFSAPRGTPIYATGDGVVVKKESNYGGYGKEVEIDHGYGYVTKYAHLDNFTVRKGQRVKRGEVIGYVGNTGASTAPHLHYEVIKDGKKVNPMNFFFQELNADEYEKMLELASRENQSLG